MTHRTTLTITAVAAALLAAGSLGKHYFPSAPTQAIVLAPPVPERLTLPVILPEKDRLLYQGIARAQKNGDWQTADALIAQLGNRLLLGEMLAERYLHRDYKAAPKELADWLAHYGDHPQAHDIYSLALAKDPSLKKSLPALRKSPTLQGYGDDNGLAAHPGDSRFSVGWRKAIDAWRKGDKAAAAKLFSSLLSYPGLSPWQHSAAAYWAHRAQAALGNQAAAARYLRMAAAQPRSFYGILARKQLRQPLGLDAAPVELSESDILEMIGEPPVRRIVALAQSDLGDLAEKELRALFPRADEKEKFRLLALARHFNLASVQITMARHLSRGGRALDFAKYPIPQWQPHDGFTIEPALIYALMRQESGFRASAASSAGALGLMQLMPQTASLMSRQSQLKGSVIEPGVNIALGQNYIRHLLDHSLVDGNLFYLLAAYNAGPGRLQEWKATIDYRDDPLLFVESIPFAQTRHYVMQVMTNYWIYAELAGMPERSVYALLKGQWPSYRAFVATTG